MSSLIFNSCWILGLALLLAAFSYHYQQAHKQDHSLRQQLRGESFAVVAWISLALVGAGAAGTSRQSWEAVLWIVLTLYAIWQAGAIWFSRNGHVKE